MADARVAFPPTYKSQLESYPWVYPASERVEKRQDFRVEPEVHENDQVAVDLSTSTTQDAMVDTPKTPTNVKFSCAPSPTAKENNLGQNGFSEVCPLVLPGIVVAYHELHTVERIGRVKTPIGLSVVKDRLFDLASIFVDFKCFA